MGLSLWCNILLANTLSQWVDRLFALLLVSFAVVQMLFGLMTSYLVTPAFVSCTFGNLLQTSLAVPASSSASYFLYHSHLEFQLLHISL